MGGMFILINHMLQKNLKEKFSSVEVESFRNPGVPKVGPNVKKNFDLL